MIPERKQASTANSTPMLARSATMSDMMAVGPTVMSLLPPKMA